MIRSALSLLLLAVAPAFAAREIPPLTGPVIDEAGVFSRAEESALDAELRAYPPALQLQVWVIESLEGEPIESLSIRAADKWKLGTAKEDRGAIILVALRDRKMRIEVGQGLEGDIPDALAGRIIDQVMKPAFREEHYYGGIRQASQLLYTRAGGDLSKLPASEVKVERRTRSRGAGTLPFPIFILLFILIAWALPFSRRSRWHGGGPWIGGRGRGFGGGGGGWGGGGGGFSGGGSSGNW